LTPWNNPTHPWKNATDPPPPPPPPPGFEQITESYIDTEGASYDEYIDYHYYDDESGGRERSYKLEDGVPLGYALWREAAERGEHECTWPGVECDENKVIIGLRWGKDRGIDFLFDCGNLP
jgi:hypothetical protein